MKVIIKSVESKVSKAGKPYFIVTMDDDSKAVTWDAKITGMTGEVECDIQETFDESGRMTRKLKLPGSPEGFKKPWGGKSPEELQIMKDKEDKISKLALYNTAVKVVGDTSTPEKVDQVITIAHYLYKDLNSDWSK